MADDIVYTPRAVIAKGEEYDVGNLKDGAGAPELAEMQELRYDQYNQCLPCLPRHR